MVITGDPDDDLALGACAQLSACGVLAAVAGLPTSGTLLRFSRACRHLAVVAQSRDEMAAAGPTVVESTVALARSLGADVVFACDVPAARLAHELKSRLRDVGFFPVPEPDTLSRLDDKWEFYQLLCELGLPTPRTWLLRSIEDARDLGLPLVLKPRNSLGGRGVYVVRTRAELERRIGLAKRRAFPVLAQQFVDAEDVDLSLLAHDGRLVSWAVQMRRGAHTLEFLIDERVVELGRRVVDACRYSGLAHFDLRYTDARRSGVVFIECNPRLWLSSPMASGLGTDFIGRGLSLAAGRSPEPFAGYRRAFCADLHAIGAALVAGRPLTPCERSFLRFALHDPIPAVVRLLRGPSSRVLPPEDVPV